MEHIPPHEMYHLSVGHELWQPPLRRYLLLLHCKQILAIPPYTVSDTGPRIYLINRVTRYMGYIRIRIYIYIYMYNHIVLWYFWGPMGPMGLGPHVLYKSGSSGGVLLFFRRKTCFLLFLHRKHRNQGVRVASLIFSPENTLFLCFIKKHRNQGVWVVSLKKKSSGNLPFSCFYMRQHRNRRGELP